MTGVPELVYISDKGKNQMRPFMYKYYLIMCFCIEESDTRESLVLVTEYKLVCFFCFVGVFFIWFFF